MVVPSDFFQVHWVDIVIWVIGFGVCAFASLGSFRLPRSGKQVQKTVSAKGDGPKVRQRPLQGSQVERPAERNGALSQSSPGNHDTVMVALLHALDHNGVDGTFDLLKDMQRLDLHIPVNILERMLQDHSPEDACALLRRMQVSGVIPDVVMFNCFISSCVTGSDMQRARIIVEEMRRAAKEPDSTTYWTLLKGCTSTGDLQGAKNSLDEMAAAGHKPTEPLYNALISAAFTAGDIQIIWDTTDMMKKNNLPATGHTTQIVMEVLRNRSSHRKLRSEDVARVMAFLDESGVNFSAHQLLLSTVIDACLWHADLPRLERILEQYWKSGLQPAVRVYGLLIKAASALNNMDWVCKLWHELVVKRELRPNPVVLGCMLDALVRGKLVDEAARILREFKAQVPPTTVMYATLTKGFLSTKEFAKSMETLRDMRMEGVPRSTVLYNMVIGAHAENGALDELPELMQSMRTDGFPPDSITYCTAVKGHCMKGAIDSALNLLREGRQSGLVFDAVVYGTIVFGCHRHNRQDLTDQLVSQMRSLGLTPASFTLATVVRMYGSQGQLHRAFEAVDAFSSLTDTRVVNALLEECTRNNTEPLPERLFKPFLTGAPGAKFFWPVVACRVQRGEFKLAESLVKLRQAELHAPSEDCPKGSLMSQLLGALRGQQGQQRKAMRLIEELRVGQPGSSCALASQYPVPVSLVAQWPSVYGEQKM